MPSYVALHHRLFRAKQVREFDRLAIEEHGIPGLTLMKRAAKAMLNVATQRWPNAKHFAVYCGAGNNGGDGFLFAALAASRNLQVSLVHTRSADKLLGDARLAWAAALEAAESGLIRVVSADEARSAQLPENADVIVDCLLGTGLQQVVRPLEQRLIEQINSSACPVLAADVPSGLSSDSGIIMGAAVNADCTVTFVAPKIGLCTASGPACCGDVMLSSLGIPAAVYEATAAQATLLNLQAMRLLLPRRSADSHKGRHGHTLLIGGGAGMGGAIILAARAALYAGSGLVSVACKEHHVASALAQQAELMVHAVRGCADLEPLLAASTSVVIGPGLGQSSWSHGLLHSLLRSEFTGPIVLDADALNIISSQGWHNMLSGKQVLTTPHPGEAARLLACSNADVQGKRLASVSALQHTLGGDCLLKGAGTLLCDTEGNVSLCSYGNASMAVGGMGDVLSGVIGALLAQGLKSSDALQLGAGLHSAAADILVADTGSTIGLTASELLPVIRRMLNQSALLPEPRIRWLDQPEQQSS